MSAFHPIPFAQLIHRVFCEYKTQGKIFGLPKEKFFQRVPNVNLSVNYMGRPAATPFGPAAGPHTQLTQNLLLSWLGGSRILELKTVQMLDQLDLPRPCIDTQNVGFNVEWSQELPLEASLREYVKAWMLIEMITSAELLGEEHAKEFSATIFDLSVGYDFKGMKSDRIHAYIQGLKDAADTINALRGEIPPEYARFRDLNYQPQIIDSVTLSTFHGCPPDEIDHIISHLLTEHGVNVIVKLNPTLLGQQEVAHILHDALGYQELVLLPETFTQDLQFDHALELIRSMSHAALSAGKRLGLKFTNTLPVKNHKGFLPGDTMYLSGPPLHVLALRLLKLVRDALGSIHWQIPMSFSAGVDVKNIAEVCTLDLIPVTVCTDMLKTPGYEKIAGYLTALAEKIEAAGAINIPDYIVKRFDHAITAIGDVFDGLRAEVKQTAGPTLAVQLEIFAALQDRLLNALQENNDSLELLTTDALIITHTLEHYHQQYGEHADGPRSFKELYDRIVAAAAQRNLETILYQAMLEPRYTAEKNSKVPRKLKVNLGLHDCTSCGNCISVCPNAANFAYYVKPAQITYQNYELTADGMTPVAGGAFTIKRFYQIANFDDCCNRCGLCGIHCVETGKPFQAKPKYFGSRSQWASAVVTDGFYVDQDAHGVQTIEGRIDGQEYALTFDPATNRATFTDWVIEGCFDAATHELLSVAPVENANPGHILDMRMYHILLTQLRGVLNSESCNYINVRYAAAPRKDVLPLRGVIAALPTPLTDQNRIDEEALRKHVRQVMACGVVGIIVPANIGDADHLPETERIQVVQTVVDEAQHRIPVIGQASALNHEVRLRRARKMLELGCDGLIINIPFTDEVQYRQRVRDMAALKPGFLLLQDDDPQGAGVPVTLLQTLCAEIEVLRGVQIDVLPTGPKATQLAQAVKGQLHLSAHRVVMQLFEALDRGLHAVIVSGLEDIYVRIFALYQAGDRAAAQAVYQQFLPILAFTSQHPDLALQFVKRALVQQGLYATANVRDPGVPFDAYHEKIAAELLEHLDILRKSFKNTSEQVSVEM